jgi:hypothetical protein
MHTLTQQAEALSKNIVTIKNKVARNDLLTMLKALDKKLSVLSQEGVECNRLHKVTTRYETITKECENMLKNIEQHLIYARLLHG